MITAQDFSIRSKNIDTLVALANQIKSSDIPVRSCDPIQVWEFHPVVSQYLEILKDREIAAAIDVANL